MWTKLFDISTNLSDKIGSAGSIVSAMGCVACFPAIASLSATLGLGFLSQFEGLFINTLLPVFAVVALVANILAATVHRRVFRALFGITGPAMVLATLYLFWTDNWSTYMFYVGLLVMFAASLWNLLSPARKACRPRTSIDPAMGNP